MRVKDLPEVTQLADDDYIFFDSVSGGSCKILAKKLLPIVTALDAVYTQTGTVYTDTPLDDLKEDLVVTATYETDITRTRVLDADDYTLSGTLAVGTSVVTVTYLNMTATFNVTVISR